MVLVPSSILFINEKRPGTGEILSTDALEPPLYWPLGTTSLERRTEGNQLMRGVSVFGLVVVMIVLGKAGAPGVAQEANPPGSYQQTCSDISAKKGACTPLAGTPKPKPPL